MVLNGFLFIIEESITMINFNNPIFVAAYEDINESCMSITWSDFVSIGCFWFNVNLRSIGLVGSYPWKIVLGVMPIAE